MRTYKKHWQLARTVMKWNLKSDIKYVAIEAKLKKKKKSSRSIGWSKVHEGWWVLRIISLNEKKTTKTTLLTLVVESEFCFAKKNVSGTTFFIIKKNSIVRFVDRFLHICSVGNRFAMDTWHFRLYATRSRPSPNSST